MADQTSRLTLCYPGPLCRNASRPRSRTGWTCACSSAGAPEPIAEALWWHRSYEDDTAQAGLLRLIIETARRL
jgi:hypothetical protein